MKYMSALFMLVSGVAFANPPKPLHSTEAPWGAPLGFSRESDFTTKVVSGGKVVVDSKLNWTWHGAASPGMDWYDAHAYCANSRVGGYSDWHLPSYWQLQSIVDHNALDIKLYKAFGAGNWDVTSLWSSDDSVVIDAPDAQDRWTYHANSGLTSWETLFLNQAALCVRGNGPAEVPVAGAARFEEPKKDLILDKRTGLFWTGDRDEKFDKQILFTVPRTLAEGVRYCENLSVYGYSNWRLPTIQELVHILNLSIPDPASGMPKLPIGFLYMASSTPIDSSGSVWGIDTRGQVSSVVPGEKAIIACVHSAN